MRTILNGNSHVSMVNVVFFLSQLNLTRVWEAEGNLGRLLTSKSNIVFFSYKKNFPLPGFRECQLNKLHACILEHLPFDDAFNIISCLMHSFRSSVDSVSVSVIKWTHFIPAATLIYTHTLVIFFMQHPKKNSTQLKWNETQCTPEGFNISSSLNCYNGTNVDEGIQLLKSYGDVTYTIDLSFVPSIEMDNVRFSRDDDGIFKHFFSSFNSTFRIATIGTCWWVSTRRYAGGMRINSESLSTNAIKAGMRRVWIIAP